MVEVTVTGMAAGGDGVGRLADGRAVFIHGGVPGDRLRVVVDDERPRFARASLLEVVEAGEGRIAPTCAHVAEGCGGCGWQHVGLAAQRRFKAGIVADALTRIGRLDPAAVPDIDPGPDLAASAYRTTVRAAVDPEGRAGLRTHHGHDVVPFGALGCPVAHPLVDEVLRTGRFPGAREVTVRAGAATGERLVVVDPAVPAATEGVPADAAVVGRDELAAGRRAWLHEEVAGRRYRVSAGSFFQARHDGAAALVEAVHAAVDPREPRRVVDLYAGVGLFAATFDGPATAVESNRSAVADARANLAGRAGARVVRADVRRWRPSPADTVVADPSRHGLGRDVVDRIAATGARTVALVSCDPGALGRDAGLLAGAGYRLGSVCLVDLFPQTPHVEVVTSWRRDPPEPPAP